MAADRPGRQLANSNWNSLIGQSLLIIQDIDRYNWLWSVKWDAPLLSFPLSRSRGLNLKCRNIIFLAD